ncbi:hypothetical protein PL373_19085 [Tenacibaculum maritimum]|nr:hypothetical protein [Tenacibaculum maritimum]MDB0603194.1 hypothetical protein [Tenacibaculum maritimum]MDB0610456.1 hypothetical protein [Tenacibaculum maritimum]
MDKAVEIKKRLREIVGANPNLPITGVVKSVESESCTVQLKSGFSVSDVKLKATISDGSDYLKIVPKIGSNVLMISLTGDKNNLTVIKIDEAEKIAYIQNDLSVLIDSTDKKISVKNNETSLVDIFKDLTDLLKKLKVFTPAGPSGTPLPKTILAIEQLEVDFNRLLK